MPCRLAALGLAVLLATSASAQRDVNVPCTLYDRGGVAVPGPTLDASALEGARRGVTYARVVTQGAAIFEVDYSSSFTPAARNAFQRAVDIWADHLTSSVPIRIRADFDPLGSLVLGQAGPRLARDEGQLVAGTWYPFALADAIVGRDLAPEDGRYDIEATFNSAQAAFYFGLDGAPPPDQFDFVTIVLHELGHGLGFLGSGDVDDGSGESSCEGGFGAGCIGFEGSNGVDYPVIFDRFLEDVEGRSLLDAFVYPNPSPALGDLLQSLALFMDAPETVRVYGSRPPVWAPTSFERGSSLSHWDEDVIRGSSAALMTPRVSRGEAFRDPGDITCALFFDIGWTLGAGCDALIGNPAPPPPLMPMPEVETLTVEIVGANPVRHSTAFRIRLPETGRLRADLYDALGRRVAVLLDREADLEERLTLRASDFASGVYQLVVRTDTEEVMQAVTVLR